MEVSILAFSVGGYVGGLEFEHVEHVEERRGVSGTIRERSLRVDDEIFPLVDLLALFGTKEPPPAGGGVFVWDIHRRVFMVDEAHEVIRCSAGDIRPLPPYLFQGDRLFRGLFPYGAKWGFLLEEELERASFAQVG